MPEQNPVPPQVESIRTDDPTILIALQREEAGRVFINNVDYTVINPGHVALGIVHYILPNLELPEDISPDSVTTYETDGIPYFGFYASSLEN